MKRATKLTPRKIPKQARAQARVDLILDATANLLETVGYDAVTTNAIADKAGVNVASLYQYFPNKQAIMAALAHRMSEVWLKVYEDFPLDFAREKNWRRCFNTYLDRLFVADAALAGSRAMRHAMNSEPTLRTIDIENDNDVAAILAEGFVVRGAMPREKAHLIATTVTGSIRYIYDFEGPSDSPPNAARIDELRRMHDAYLATYFDADH